MGGVDKVDQVTTYYSTPRKTSRWQLKLFFHMVDICLWNANYLFNIDNQEIMTYLKFRDSIIERYVSTSIAPQPSPQPNQQHFPQAVSGSRVRCRYCSRQGKNSTSKFVCNICTDEKHRPVGLCFKNENNCFIKFHTEKLHLNFVRK